MPLLSRLYIKTALVHLFAGLAMGAFSSHPAVFHVLTVGWLTQLIFGVAYWLFPRHSKEAPYGNFRLVGAAWGLLNAGLLLRIPAEPRAHVEAWGSLLLASSALQGTAALLLVVYFWTRVKTRK
ncbi:MAG: hypothetical protein COV99_02055 [Bacteroidetes bacterium CG12_big_fil_rev_8_21_14_0_65_60_17]|nr:MAG: hypothetical protein COV99_02055 [Bacteroidetes bacterium CG12_big_fil_rev_8_21_14_0_65_60_17]